MPNRSLIASVFVLLASASLLLADEWPVRPTVPTASQRCPAPTPVACDPVPVGCCWGMGLSQAAHFQATIEVQVRLVQMSDAGLKNCKVAFQGDCGKRFAFVDAKGLSDLLESVQSDPKAHIVCMPRLMVMDGQTACVRTACEEFERVGIEMNAKDGIVQTRCEMVQRGTHLEVVPVVSADRKFIQLKVHCKAGVLPSEKPQGAGCLSGCQAASGTCCPSEKCDAAACCAMFAVPCGKSIVVHVGAMTCTEPCAKSLLSKIPYLSRLFEPGIAVCQKQLLLIATPKVFYPMPPVLPPAHADCMFPCIKPAAPAVLVPVPLPLPPQHVSPTPTRAMSPVEQRAAKMAEKLVEKYYMAIERGEPEKARKFARQAVDLDPGCFAGTQASRNAQNPKVRLNQLLNQSDTGGQIKNEWKRIWFNDAPSHLTPVRVHGGIQ